MQTLGEINLKNTVTVKVDCQVNQDVIIKNFQIVMNCLKDLKDGQDGLKNDFSNLDDKYKLIEKKLQNINQNSNDSKGNEQKLKDFSHQDSKNEGASNMNDFSKLIRQLQQKTDKQGQSIVGNIKDLSLLQKQMIQVKEEIQKLKLKGDGNNNQNKNNTGVENYESMNNINKQVNNNKQQIRKVYGDLEKMKEEIKQLREDLEKLKDGESAFDKNTSTNQKGENNRDGNDLKDIKNMIRDLRDKTRDLERQSENNKNLTIQLNKTVDNLSEDSQNMKKQLQNLLNLIKNLQATSNVSGNNTGNMLEDLSKELDNLKNRIHQLERQNRINSKTSIEDSSSKIHQRGTYTQSKFHAKGDEDKLREIITRLEVLEKYMGSKHSVDDSRSDKQKLPLIKRPKLPKERGDGSLYEKSSAKKDMVELKNELQGWINNYFNNMKTKDNFDEIELRIQEIRNAINRKADQQGMKKGLTFLENKINQLYLFLTEPDGQDAMIVRKGFNCLSCSKKVEKLKGKLGPHINWNNMTATNYSPPKVGYSRHMGDGSIDKQDDL